MDNKKDIWVEVPIAKCIGSKSQSWLASVRVTVYYRRRYDGHRSPQVWSVRCGSVGFKTL